MIPEKRIVLQRPPGLHFELADGREFEIPAVTRGRWTRAQALEKAALESDEIAEQDGLHIRQLEILTEDSGLPVSELRYVDVLDFLTALTADFYGKDAAESVAWGRLLRRRFALGLLGEANSSAIYPDAAPTTETVAATPASE